MLKTESYCKEELGMETAYLNTFDAHGFYSRLGYKPCPPVCFYGGSLELPETFRKAMTTTKSPQPSTVTTTTSKCDNPTAANFSITSPAPLPVTLPPPPPPLPPPPPPPPPPNGVPLSSQGGAGGEDVATLCTRLYKLTTLEEVHVSPLDSPPRSLPEEIPKNRNLNKANICRATLNKDFMKKKL